MSYCFEVGFKQIFKYLLMTYFVVSISPSYSQMPQARYPVNNDRVSPTPKFTAIESSLVASGVTYNVVLSEQPRGGETGQYMDFWVKESLPPSSLLDTNLNRVGWDTSWIRKTRNGTYTGPATTIPNATPASLTFGKTYYWHIVGTNGTKSAENTFVILESARPTPIHNSPTDGATIYSSSQDPCFSWSMSVATGFSNYTIIVSTTPDFQTTRWQYQITSATTTSVCWNNGLSWSAKGSSPPANPGALLNNTTYYWRVMATYSDGAITGRDFSGRSFVHRYSSSSSSPTISSRSSSSSSSLTPSSSSRSSSSSSAPIITVTTTYQHDELGRLKAVTHSN